MKWLEKIQLDFAQYLYLKAFIKLSKSEQVWIKKNKFG